MYTLYSSVIRYSEYNISVKIKHFTSILNIFAITSFYGGIVIVQYLYIIPKASIN